MAKRLGPIESDLYSNLQSLIQSDFEQFIKEAFGDIKNIDYLLSQKEILNERSLQVDIARQNLNLALQQYKNQNDKKYFSIRDRAKDYIENNSNTFILSDSLEKYSQAVESQSQVLEIIYKAIIQFQQTLSNKLGFEIAFFYTTVRNAKIKLYSSNVDDIFSILHINSDQSVSIAHKGMNEITFQKQQNSQTKKGITALKNIIKNEIKVNNNDSKQKILDALSNEEETYKEILLRQSHNEQHIVLWKIENEWLSQKIQNRGFIEEVRQRFLLQIHLQEIYNLFQDKSKPQNYITKKISNTPSQEVWIHNYIRSKYGIANVDSRSGLIVDDHLLRIDSLLQPIKELLGLNNTNKKYISIASKTESSNFTGFNQFFTMLQHFQNVLQKKESKRQLQKYLKETFFQEGSKITKNLDDIATKEIKDIIEQFESWMENR